MATLSGITRPFLSGTSFVLLLFGAAGRTRAQSPLLLSARTIAAADTRAGCAWSMSQTAALSSTAWRVAVHASPSVGAMASPVASPVGSPVARRYTQPLVSADVGPVAMGAWRISAAAGAGPAPGKCSALADWTRAWFRVARAGAHLGAAIAVGAMAPGATEPSRDRQGVTASVWHERGHTRFGIDLRLTSAIAQWMQPVSRSELRLDSVRTDSLGGGWLYRNRIVTVTDSGLATVRARGTDWRARWDQRVGRAMLQFTLGGSRTRTGLRPDGTRIDSITGPSASRTPARIDLWGRADARVMMSTTSDLLLGFALVPPQPLYRQTAGRVYSVGLAFAAPARERPAPRTIPIAREPAGASFEVRRLDADDSRVVAANGMADTVRVLLRVHHLSARQIEVSGEPFGWQSVTMQRTDPGWWETVLSVRPGTYRLSLRIDGARWTAPPGFPALHDEFGGEVALVTIR